MLIKVTGSITISKDIKTVFDFISNLEQDKLWRKEINATTMSGKPQINVLATESSFLSKKTPNNILNLICTEYLENKQVVYQTAPESTFFLKSIRQVELKSENETSVLYSIEFDKNIVKHALGFPLPAFLITFVARMDMKKYLAQLKAVLEKNGAKS